MAAVRPNLETFSRKMQEKDYGEWLVRLLCKPLAFFFPLFFVIYPLHTVVLENSLNLTLHLWCVVLHFHTVLLFRCTRPKLWQQHFEVHWISALSRHHGMLLGTVASVSVSFHLFARKIQSFNTLHQGCCLRKFFGAKEVRSPSNISRCPFRKKKVHVT